MPERNEADTFTLEELRAVLKNVKNGKAPGPDGIPMELFKYATSGVQRRLLNLLNEICREGKLTEDLKSAIAVPIFKKGDLSKMENYRGISLLCTAYKILAKLTARRLADLSEEFLLECQHGFRKRRSCTNASYTIKLIMEKQIEFNKQTHICFVDFKKAYDKVDQARLFEILVDKNIPRNLIRTLRTMYADTRIVGGPFWRSFLLHSVDEIAPPLPILFYSFDCWCYVQLILDDFISFLVKHGVPCTFP